MRLHPALVGLLLVISCGVARGEIKVTERIRTYTVTGSTIQEVVRSMKRRGPDSTLHGRRALGLSDFRHRTRMRTSRKEGRCQVVGVSISLRIYHTWPRLSKKSTLAKSHRARWRTIRRMIVRHERRHGALYRQFARELQLNLKRIPPQSQCSHLRDRQRSVTKKLLARDRKRNRRFDRIQYKPFNRRLKRLAPK